MTQRKIANILNDGDLLINLIQTTRDLVGLMGRYRDVGAPCIYSELMMKMIPTKDILNPMVWTSSNELRASGSQTTHQCLLRYLWEHDADQFQYGHQYSNRDSE